METKELETSINKMTETINAIQKNAEKSGIDAQKAVELATELKAKIEGQKFATPEDIKAFQGEMQKQFDELATIAKKGQKTEVKTFGEAIAEKFDVKEAQGQLSSRSGKYRIEMPEVKSMTIASSVTGDVMATYSPRQAILPSQKANFRDLVPTFNSETGLYVFYAETATSNNIGVQAEGSTKGENSYALSEVKVVNQYIAGIVNFSKQLTFSLPWLSQTLPRLLQRDFFKKENANFYNEVIAAASTAATTSETDKVLKLIDYIAYQEAQNYNASVAIVNPTDYANLVKSTYAKGYYPGAGSVDFTSGGMTINNTPVVKAAFATAGEVLILDQDYIERVQVSGLAIELSYEDGYNFQKNMVTARIECLEEINLMLAASAQYKAL